MAAESNRWWRYADKLKPEFTRLLLGFEEDTDKNNETGPSEAVS